MYRRHSANNSCCCTWHIRRLLQLADSLLRYVYVSWKCNALHPTNRAKSEIMGVVVIGLHLSSLPICNHSCFRSSFTSYRSHMKEQQAYAISNRRITSTFCSDPAFLCGHCSYCEPLSPPFCFQPLPLWFLTLPPTWFSSKSLRTPSPSPQPFLLLHIFNFVYQTIARNASSGLRCGWPSAGDHSEGAADEVRRGTE